MQRTAHSDVRMNQRGITGEMVALALDHGEPDGDKTVLSAKVCRQLIEELKQKQKRLEHALKKGGITVVSDGDALITIYRANSFSTSKAKKSRG
ncbi:MAG: hypothetical protein ACU0DK_05695 [Pseudooceanicola sp.]